MRLHFFVSTAAALAVLSSLLTPSLASALSSNQVVASLTSIKHDADSVASRSATTAQFRDSARKLGVEWAKVEPSIVQQGHVVEAHFLNQYVSAFERDWKTPAAARSDAKQIDDNVVALIKSLR